MKANLTPPARVAADDEPKDARVNVGPHLYPENYDHFHRTEYRLDTPHKEIVLSQMDYERFREFVLETIGLDYPEDKRYLLGWGLDKVMEATACASLDDLYSLLRAASPTSVIWDRLVSALTVGETYFFRNSYHFDALAKHILPDIMSRREHSSRRIRIWSAGCATGEEPYSVAMLLRELIPHLESWNILILATDINREALRKAKEGVYAAWSFRGVDKRVQDAYFQPDDQKQFAIADEVKRMVTFEHLNLVTDPYPSLANNTNAMDVILCRNVTIYFKAEVTRKVLANLHASLTDGGWLIPGAAEPNMVFYSEFEPRNFPGTTVYQKPATSKRMPSSIWAFQPAAIAAAPVAAPLPGKPAARTTEPPPVKLPPARDAYQVALELVRAGKIDEALAKLYEKLDQDANFVPTYYALGKIYANKGNLEQAQSWCEKAIKKDKLHPEPYYTLSLVYEQNGLIEMAMDALKKAIYLDRNFIMAHYNLAQLYQCQGDEASARKSLENAARLLQAQPREAKVPEGDGMAAGRLLELIQSELT